jgi:hypothetical protein
MGTWDDDDAGILLNADAELWYFDQPEGKVAEAEAADHSQHHQGQLPLPAMSSFILINVVFM